MKPINVGLLGIGEVAAMNVVLNMMLLAILPAAGMGIAAATLVGGALGRGDVVDALRRRDHQALHRAQWRGVAQRFGQERQRAVDAVHALDVHRQRIQKNTGHGMASNLRQGGVRGGRPRHIFRLVHTPSANDEQLVCA